MIAKLMAALAALVISLAALFGAAPAQASPSSYLNDLSNSPWGFYGDVETWLAIGYAVCHRIEMGWNQTELVNFVVGNTGAGDQPTGPVYYVSKDRR